MKKFFTFIAVAALTLGISSCNIKIENPKASNFVGTWDLQTIEIVGTDGAVTTSASKTLDYLVITKETIAFYEAGKLAEEAPFAVKDNMIYVDGVATYKVDNLTFKEMTISRDGFGLLVSTYRYYYKKR